MSKNEHTGFRVLRTVVGALGTSSGALVAGITRDTHDCEFCGFEERKMN